MTVAAVHHSKVKITPKNGWSTTQSHSDSAVLFPCSPVRVTPHAHLLPWQPADKGSSSKQSSWSVSQTSHKQNILQKHKSPPLLWTFLKMSFLFLGTFCHSHFQSFSVMYCRCHNYQYPISGDKQTGHIQELKKASIQSQAEDNYWLSGGPHVTETCWWQSANISSFPKYTKCCPCFWLLSCRQQFEKCSTTPWLLDHTVHLEVSAKKSSRGTVST